MFFIPLKKIHSVYYVFFSVLLDYLWVGANDRISEGTFVWDSTGKKLSPGYQGWRPGYPVSSCMTSNYDCVMITDSSNTFPSWIETACSSNFGGICELQPTYSSKF